MYCSHLLSAASVFNCRWLYYTQEDANGMYEAQGKFKMEELSEKVQNASTHMLQNHDRAQQAVKFQGDGCKFKMQMHLSGVGMDIAAFKVSPPP